MAWRADEDEGSLNGLGSTWEDGWMDGFYAACELRGGFACVCIDTDETIAAI